jgi:hypothetical protein
MPLTADELDRVNEYREGQSYSDENSAMVKNGSKIKPKLTKSPFVQTLEYGANAGGYWNYDSMNLQLEDCIDCMTALYPHIQPVFLFDHSCGHDRMQPDGLSTTKIRKNFGGTQPKMRKSQLTQLQIFGPHQNLPHQMKLNDTQSMQFEEGNYGPFYMSPAEAERRKFDIRTGRKAEKYLKKSELIRRLKVEGISDPKGSLKQIQQKAVQLHLPIKYTYDVILEGWMGKPKGSLQILYERGWIDPTDLSSYTLEGKKDDMGILRKETSLKLLIEMQPDFVSELTLLQFHGVKLGAIIDRSPKCHPEIAGEGIEYVWALAKLWFRRQPKSNRCSKELFHRMVDASTSPFDVCSIDKVRKCSRRARQYMLAYKAIAAISDENQQHQDPQ